MSFKGLLAGISKTTKRLSLKILTRSKRRNLYQSLLFECDALQREAEVLIEQCRLKLTQPEFNEWNTVLDVLKAERKKLIPFSGYGSRSSAELAGISTAESFKCDVTTFNQNSHELARRCESRRGRHIEMSGEDIGIEGEQELQQVEDNSDFHISNLAVSEKEKLRSRSAPVKTSVAFDLKDQERRCEAVLATRMIVHTPENALGLHFNGGPDRLQHSAVYSSNRTISLIVEYSEDQNCKNQLGMSTCTTLVVSTITMAFGYIPALFTASTLVVRLRPRSSLKIDYQSRLYEGDANLSEASVHYAEIQDTINNQRERIGWRAQFDRLRIERGQLAMDVFTYRSARAQADALARAERYRTNAKELNSTVTEAYHLALASTAGKSTPVASSTSHIFNHHDGPRILSVYTNNSLDVWAHMEKPDTNAVHRVPTSKLTNSIIPECDGYTESPEPLTYPGYDIPRAVGALTAAAAANPMNFCILTIPRHAPSNLDASLCETHLSTDTQNAGRPPGSDGRMHKVLLVIWINLPSHSIHLPTRKVQRGEKMKENMDDAIKEAFGDRIEKIDLTDLRQEGRLTSFGSIMGQCLINFFLNSGKPTRPSFVQTAARRYTKLVEYVFWKNKRRTTFDQSHPPLTYAPATI
ncbi:predicted protein [Postia placenta Mad-698-R]|uniref:Uncharacterized protein n=1 Tax=Postia placenta MAD-698-R-SB12 TaxID=670580 RepID=A0A1X6NBX0_9APHY|nr:hypothetical protein POSPLADRAFT_1043542 [Postia placenta MAD-698-R-SB12]EED79248.1 predicted protein [Postia placenta Mad-698-R]OSX66020.1 hypothetical protein POSPLADRAFT_1043542 [Postia placenta MAD-698-R-SB12]